MLVESIKEKAQFNASHFSATPLAKTEHSAVMVVGLEAGQAIPVHHPGTDVTIIVIEGQLTLVSGDDQLENAGPGAVLHSKAGQARGIHASTKSVVVAVASPPPTPADHKEVQEHLAKGTWR